MPFLPQIPDPFVTLLPFFYGRLVLGKVVAHARFVPLSAPLSEHSRRHGNVACAISNKHEDPLTPIFRPQPHAHLEGICKLRCKAQGRMRRVSTQEAGGIWA